MTMCLRVAQWVPTTDPAEVGDGIKTTNPPTTHKKLTTTFFLPGAGSGSGVPEAPSDGQQYARINASWAVVAAPAVIDGGTF